MKSRRYACGLPTVIRFVRRPAIAQLVENCRTPNWVLKGYSVSWVSLFQGSIATRCRPLDLKIHCPLDTTWRTMQGYFGHISTLNRFYVHPPTPGFPPSSFEPQKRALYLSLKFTVSEDMARDPEEEISLDEEVTRSAQMMVGSAYITRVIFRCTGKKLWTISPSGDCSVTE